LLLALVLGVLAPACGGGKGDKDDKDGAVQGDSAGVADRGAADRGAVLGTDGPARDQPPLAVDMAPLPKSCPCPLDSYCDLATNTCVVGCKSHEHCNKGKYCDPATELCKVGCRTEADCSDDNNPCTDLTCQGGKCTQVPNSVACADDGNSCTADVCSGGACTHPPANDGKLCGKTLDCSDYRCQGGACVETHFKAGKACPDDGDGCTTDECDGKGVCTHATKADGSSCPNTWGGWDAKCFKGKCYPKRYQCCGYSSLTYLNFTTKKTESWTGTNSCGCSGSTMKWSGYYSGYKLDHSEYCASCEHPSGAYCQSCYDLP
jgi:hypothetical protein